MSHFTIVTEDTALIERLHAKMMHGELIELEGISFMPIEQNIENCKKLTLSAQSVDFVSVPAGTGRTSPDYRPETGATCEALHKSGQWARVTILCRMAGSPSCACRDENDRLWWATEFRRTRNAARTKVCDEMFGVLLSLPEDRRHNRSDIVEALYDAGYRKFETVDGEA